MEPISLTGGGNQSNVVRCLIRLAYHFLHTHSIMLILASHSCIIVAESSDNEPVEPTESVEPEPSAECVVEPEEHQGK